MVSYQCNVFTPVAVAVVVDDVVVVVVAAAVVLFVARESADSMLAA